MELKKFRVTGNGNVKHDDRYYEAGDIMLLNEDQAAVLRAIGKVEPVVEQLLATPQGAQPDGFPQHDTMTAPKVNVQPDSQSQPLAPAVPATPATETVTQPVAEAKLDAQQTPPQTASKQPTQEQIARDMEQLG